ncbi:MAG: DUF2807 domain-containing protein [Bacteroidia bacterium]|nr:DUF2807 domain-containing protein [Bacteroidia bacterium]
MRNISFIALLLIMFGCDKKNAWDCIQTAGQQLEYDVEVNDFTRILVNRDVQLFISYDNEYNVRVVTGENLVSDINVEVVGNQLELTDNNTCNYVRDYGITKIYVSAPNLTEIRNSSQYEIQSENTLQFDELVLNSEDFNEPGSFNVGDFRLDVDSERLQIVSNNLSSFFISGTVDRLNIGFFSGDGRFDGENLVAQQIQVFHRGSNDMIVYPVESLSGEIRSTGDLISINVPAEVDVQEYYTGQLIFQD